MMKTIAQRDEVMAAARVRWVRIAGLRAQGQTLQKIADAEGITRERVRQIVSQGERYLKHQAEKEAMP
jgi:DNA-directed RNA polymerase sigma subunit (sigma70/sigma32)